MKSKNNLETLELQAKKKKNIVFISVIGLLLAILMFSFINSFLSVDKKEIYEKRKLSKEDSLEVIKNPEYKENWAISMENRLKKQEDRMSELVDLVKNQQDVVVSNLKGFMNKNNENLKTEINLLKTSQIEQNKNLKKEMEKKSEEQNERIKQLEELTQNKIKNIQKQVNLSKDTIIGKNDLFEGDSVKLIKRDLKSGKYNIKELTKRLNNIIKNINDPILENAVLKSPNLSLEDKINIVEKNTNEKPIKKEKETNEKPIKKSEIKSNPKKIKPMNKKKHMVIVDIDTSFNKKIIVAKNKIDKKVNSKKKITFEPYHISTGFMKAYMVTGAYAPAFQEGSVEPLPVLFEAQGDIIMSNNTVGTLDKCFLLGSAKGNMNSQTADIKLVSISCLINGGKERVEGTISGWVIGENGIPGLQGELLHKNGAWLARTFISGFFETFSSALSGSGSNVTAIPYGGSNNTGSTNNGTSVSGAINSNLLQAGASGISNVFSQLGKYYLKMAQQIFPVIEVKGGRTVNILLIGGEELTVVKNNVVSTTDMSDKSTEIELNKKQKQDIIPSENAFKQAILDNSNQDSNINETTKAKDFGDIPGPVNEE